MTGREGTTFSRQACTSAPMAFPPGGAVLALEDYNDTGGPVGEGGGLRTSLEGYV